MSGLLGVMGAALLVVGAVAGAEELKVARPIEVARVMAGELDEARVSWWGYDAEDSTEFMQAAINSGARRLVVDKMPGPWVSRPLFCASDQEIFFESGVEVVALSGAYKHRHDCLINMRSVTNVTLRGPGATLRMRREEYARGEWRHVVSMRSSFNIKILGLTLADGGGDGIYLGSDASRNPCTDVVIRDVVCERNRRQGISVISAENLLIEDTILRDTAGTHPAAGIDFEPNSEFQRLKNLVLRNVVSENNQGDGYIFSLRRLTAETEPLDIRLENCIARNNRMSVRVATLNSGDDAVRGEILLKDCALEGSRSYGIMINRKPAHGVGVTFDNCVLSDSGGESAPDIIFMQAIDDVAPVGGIRFRDMRVASSGGKPWLKWLSGYFAEEETITGGLELSIGDKTEDIEIADWLRENYPSRLERVVERTGGDLSKARVVNDFSSESRFSRIHYRRSGEFLFYAEAGKEAVLRCIQRQSGGRAAEITPLVVLDADGAELGKFPMPGYDEEGVVRFAPGESGFYRLLFAAGGNAVAITAANVPVALDVSRGAINLISSPGNLWAAIPRGSESFALGVAGEGEGETIKATVYNPKGEQVWSMDSIAQSERFYAGSAESEAGGLWRLSLSKASSGYLDDHYVDLLGVPGYLFLCDKKFWEF